MFNFARDDMHLPNASERSEASEIQKALKTLKYSQLCIEIYQRVFERDIQRLGCKK